MPTILLLHLVIFFSSCSPTQGKILPSFQDLLETTVDLTAAAGISLALFVWISFAMGLSYFIIKLIWKLLGRNEPRPMPRERSPSEFPLKELSPPLVTVSLDVESGRVSFNPPADLQNRQNHEVYALDTEDEEKKPLRPVLHVSVGDKTIRMLWDTGSSISFIPKRLATNVFYAVRWFREKEVVRVKTAGQEEIGMIGEIQVPVRIGTHRFEHKLLVAPDEYRPFDGVLGMDLFAKMNAQGVEWKLNAQAKTMVVGNDLLPLIDGPDHIYYVPTGHTVTLKAGEQCHVPAYGEANAFVSTCFLPLTPWMRIFVPFRALNSSAVRPEYTLLHPWYSDPMRVRMYNHGTSEFVESYDNPLMEAQIVRLRTVVEIEELQKKKTEESQVLNDFNESFFKK